MFKVQTLNQISPLGLARFDAKRFLVGADVTDPDAIMLRSFKMHDMPLPARLKAVGRAGAGVNNIPVALLSARGVPVFNAPGANANAVKELVVAGLLIASRNLRTAWEFAATLTGTDAEISRAVEAGKKVYAGFELPGRVLGVVGLGAIGRLVAHAGLVLGMKVIGFDPELTVEGAWQLSADVQKAGSVATLLREADFVSFHVPLVDATRHMINADTVGLLKSSATVLNFAREGVVDDEAVVAALDAGRLHAYVCDFPTNRLKGHPKVVALPHLGASTREAEDNCAVMVADELCDFLENGNIRNAVNFPEVVVAREGACRLVVAHANVPNMVGQISTAMARAGLNIHNLVNKSRSDLAYTLVDLDSMLPDAVYDEIAAIPGVMSARKILA
ncbi:phosphoglycerate dehydrogenase [Acidiferrobacter sp.]|uniref:phosphoglycerate dehydrogenase n=1 Tax=Acidiferrobacter sp. TaxID=1872107 RepID=UPI00261FD990|nr:phosphoglycerate dehydrogenase [Acidiferrobacter sp.]